MMDSETSKAKKLFINISNHPSCKWGDNQLAAVRALADEIVDFPFPNIPPEADSGDVHEIARHFFPKVIEAAKGYEIAAVHLMGEMVFTFCMCRMLLESGIRVVASTSVRNVVEISESKRIASFDFVRFRDYRL